MRALFAGTVGTLLLAVATPAIGLQVVHSN